MPKRYTPKDFQWIFNEINQAPDRSAIVVSGAWLESALEAAIEFRLRETENNREKGILFSGEGGLFSTFYAKIWAAYFLKIIGPKARDQIDIIRRIRNVCSHDMNPVSFQNNAEIKSRCMELTMGTLGAPPSPDQRQRFLDTSSFFTANLYMRSSSNDAEIRAAYEGLAPDLDL